MKNDSEPSTDFPDSPTAKETPDDIWDQPALTPRECADRIAKLREEGRLPNPEHLQKAVTKAEEYLTSLRSRSS